MCVGLTLVASLTGCAALKTKFTRKKKPKTNLPVHYQVRKYDIKPSLELYEKHYILWINWHRELVDELGDNYKSDLRSIRQISGNLEDMATLLVDEEAEKLAPHIDDVKEVRVIIEGRNMTQSNETRIRRILEREYRSIKREFSPVKMAGLIRQEYKTRDTD